MAAAHATISPADRIRELGAINNDIAAMLASAGSAIQALTDQRVTTDEAQESDSPEDDDSDKRTSAQKKAFDTHTKSYFITLQSICARLNRQAYALEEAGIIAADIPILTLADAAKATAGNGPAGSGVGAMEGEKIRNGGLGNFDVGWLNSRGNKVGLEKEAEIINEVRSLVKKIATRSNGDSVGSVDEHMDEGS